MSPEFKEAVLSGLRLLGAVLKVLGAVLIFLATASAIYMALRVEATLHDTVRFGFTAAMLIWGTQTYVSDTKKDA